MSDKPVSLSSLITESKTVGIDFPGFPGCNVELCYLGKSELLKLRKRSLKTNWDKKTRQPLEELDEDKFIHEYSKAVIKGWKGLKYRYLEELLLVDIAELNPEDELPYTQENAELLMTNSSTFDTWVTETVSELENFTGSK